MGIWDTLPDEMTVAEAADILQKHPQQVRWLIAHGHLTARRVGQRLLLVTKESVQKEAKRGRYQRRKPSP